MRYGRKEEEGKNRSTFGYAQQVIRFAEGVETSRISFPDPVHRHPSLYQGSGFRWVNAREGASEVPFYLLPGDLSWHWKAAPSHCPPATTPWPPNPVLDLGTEGIYKQQSIHMQPFLTIRCFQIATKSPCDCCTYW